MTNYGLSDREVNFFWEIRECENETSVFPYIKYELDIQPRNKIFQSL